MEKHPCLTGLHESVHYVFTIREIIVFGNRYIISSICIFGIICNLLNLCVLLQRRLKESPYTYLTGLALADMFTLMLVAPVSILRGDWIRDETLFLKFAQIELKIHIPLANYFGQVSILITLALTIERYLFTTYPLRTRIYCKPVYARIVIGIILLVAGLLNFPRFFKDEMTSLIESVERFNSSDCKTHPFLIEHSSINSSRIGQCFCLNISKNYWFKKIHDPYLYSMFFLNQILPFFILSYLNFQLIRRVQKSNRWTLEEFVTVTVEQQLRRAPNARKIKQKRLREEDRLTKTLVAIVVVFLVCNTFTIVTHPSLMYELTKKSYPYYMNHIFPLQILITNIMLCLNYSINFFFYCAFNQKFLNTLRLIFVRHRICICLSKSDQNDKLPTQRLIFSNRYSSNSSSYYFSSKSLRDSSLQAINSCNEFHLKNLKRNTSRESFLNENNSTSQQHRIVK